MGFEDQREPVDPPGYVSGKKMNSEGLCIASLATYRVVLAYTVVFSLMRCFSLAEQHEAHLLRNSNFTGL
jgi:hypothetical protein